MSFFLSIEFQTRKRYLFVRKHDFNGASKFFLRKLYWYSIFVFLGHWNLHTFYVFSNIIGGTASADASLIHIRGCNIIKGVAPIFVMPIASSVTIFLKKVLAQGCEGCFLTVGIKGRRRPALCLWYCFYQTVGPAPFLRSAKFEICILPSR